MLYDVTVIDRWGRHYSWSGARVLPHQEGSLQVFMPRGDGSERIMSVFSRDDWASYTVSLRREVVE